MLTTKPRVNLMFGMRNYVAYQHSHVYKVNELLHSSFSCDPLLITLKCLFVYLFTVFLKSSLRELTFLLPFQLKPRSQHHQVGWSLIWWKMSLLMAGGLEPDDL